MSVGLPHIIGNCELLNCVCKTNFIFWNLSNVFSRLSRVPSESGINWQFPYDRDPYQIKNFGLPESTSQVNLFFLSVTKILRKQKLLTQQYTILINKAHVPLKNQFSPPRNCKKTLSVIESSSHPDSDILWFLILNRENKKYKKIKNTTGLWISYLWSHSQERWSNTTLDNRHCHQASTTKQSIYKPNTWWN